MKVFSLFAGILALGLLSGCAFTEFKTERPPVKDDRMTFVENGNYNSARFVGLYSFCFLYTQVGRPC